MATKDPSPIVDVFIWASAGTTSACSGFGPKSSLHHNPTAPSNSSGSRPGFPHESHHPTGPPLSFSIRARRQRQRAAFSCGDWVSAGLCHGRWGDAAAEDNSAHDGGASVPREYADPFLPRGDRGTTAGGIGQRKDVAEDSRDHYAKAAPRVDDSAVESSQASRDEARVGAQIPASAIRLMEEIALGDGRVTPSAPDEREEAGRASACEAVCAPGEDCAMECEQAKAVKARTSSSQSSNLTATNATAATVAMAATAATAAMAATGVSASNAVAASGDEAGRGSSSRSSSSSNSTVIAPSSSPSSPPPVLRAPCASTAQLPLAEDAGGAHGRESDAQGAEAVWVAEEGEERRVRRKEEMPVGRREERRRSILEGAAARGADEEEEREIMVLVGRRKRRHEGEQGCTVGELRHVAVLQQAAHGEARRPCGGAEEDQPHPVKHARSKRVKVAHRFFRPQQLLSEKYRKADLRIQVGGEPASMGMGEGRRSGAGASGAGDGGEDDDVVEVPVWGGEDGRRGKAAAVGSGEWGKEGHAAVVGERESRQGAMGDAVSGEPLGHTREKGACTAGGERQQLRADEPCGSCTAGSSAEGTAGGTAAVVSAGSSAVSPSGSGSGIRHEPDGTLDDPLVRAAHRLSGSPTHFQLPEALMQGLGARRRGGSGEWCAEGVRSAGRRYAGGLRGRGTCGRGRRAVGRRRRGSGWVCEGEGDKCGDVGGVVVERKDNEEVEEGGEGEEGSERCEGEEEEEQFGEGEESGNEGEEEEEEEEMMVMEVSVLSDDDAGEDREQAEEQEVREVGREEVENEDEEEEEDDVVEVGMVVTRTAAKSRQQQQQTKKRVEAEMIVKEHDAPKQSVALKESSTVESDEQWEDDVDVDVVQTLAGEGRKAVQEGGLGFRSRKRQREGEKMGTHSMLGGRRKRWGREAGVC
ncbi:hypothetical protein CLOM_g9492 [Closterium sp. NIES-68]|nr:hypothetical protein CLOM_g9492 [Closterium sp. NIES-68]